MKNHPWVKGFGFYKKGIIVDYHEIPIDLQIAERVKKYKGVSRKDLADYIKNNNHNEFTTFYYLLLKQKIRNNKFSVADISSDVFVFKKKNQKDLVLRSAEDRPKS